MVNFLIKLVPILVIADGIGSLLLPSKWQKHFFWLDAGRIIRAGIGLLLLLYFI